MISLLSGPSGSHCGSTSSDRYLVASPRWPRYSFAHAILSASAVHVPLFRSTRSTFLVQAIFSSSSGRARQALPGVSAHLVDPRPVGIHIGDRRRRTGLGAGRITAAQVAFDHLAADRVVIHRTKRT